MIKIEFTEEEIEKLHYERFHHPNAKVQKKMEVLYLKSQGVKPGEIVKIGRVSMKTQERYCREYKEGGIERLKEIRMKGQRSELEKYRGRIEEYFRENPPMTVKEAGAKIKEITGIERKETAVRGYLKRLGMKRRKVGMIPAKVDIEKQEEFKKKELEPRIEEAKAGKRELYFIDGAHFVFKAFLGMIWSMKRIFVKAPAGRKRLNVLAGLNAITLEVVTVQNLTYITAEVVCTLLLELAKKHTEKVITVVLDNAKYQRCKLVQETAIRLGIELLFLPTYSPNLNLIERFWKYVKKECLYSRYYETFNEFEKAISKCIEEASSKEKRKMETLLTLEFQTFKGVPVIGGKADIKLFPVPTKAARKSSSLAA